MEIDMTETLADLHPPRPSRMGVEVREMVASTLIEHVFSWHVNAAKRAGEKPKGWPDLRQALASSADPNNYIFAKNLEKFGLEPDGHLVELLSFQEELQHREAVKSWVKAFTIQIPSTYRRFVSLRQFAKCEILDRNNETASLCIKPVDFPYDIGGRSAGIWVPFEDAIPIIGTIGEAAPAEGGAA
jgi:hypothetical protein